MPFTDPEHRRAYDRRRKRDLRAGKLVGSAELARLVELRAVGGLQALLAEAVSLILHDPKAKDLDKGRALVGVVAQGLRLLEARELEQRIEALERVLGAREPLKLPPKRF